MRILKTGLTIDSHDIFQNPLSVKKSISARIDGNHALMQNTVIKGSSKTVLYESNKLLNNSGVMYFYCYAGMENPLSGLDIQIINKSNESANFMRILPGDFAFLPLWVGDGNGVKIILKNTDPVKSGTLDWIMCLKS